MKEHSQVVEVEEVGKRFGSLLHDFFSERGIQYEDNDGMVRAGYAIGNLSFLIEAFLDSDQDLRIQIGYIWTVPQSAFALVEAVAHDYEKILGAGFDVLLNKELQTLGVEFFVPRQFSLKDSKKWLAKAFNMAFREMPAMYEKCHLGNMALSPQDFKLLVMQPASYV